MIEEGPPPAQTETDALLVCRMESGTALGMAVSDVSMAMVSTKRVIDIEAWSVLRGLGEKMLAGKGEGMVILHRRRTSQAESRRQWNYDKLVECGLRLVRLPAIFRGCASPPRSGMPTQALSVSPTAAEPHPGDAHQFFLPHFSTFTKGLTTRTSLLLNWICL